MNVVRVTLLKGQCIQDLTMQTTGSLELLFDFAIFNEISITETPVIGIDYKEIPAIDNEFVVLQYKQKGILPATDIERSILSQQFFEPGFVEPGFVE